jgi:hypothetical protein
MGHNPKGHLQVAIGRKSVAYDRLPYPRVDKLGFEWVLCIRIPTWEDRLSELRCAIVKSTALQFRSYSGNTWLWVSNQRKEYRKHLQAAHHLDHLPNPAIGKFRFRMGQP